jgi:hypothetical protein
MKAPAPAPATDMETPSAELPGNRRSAHRGRVVARDSLHNITIGVVLTFFHPRHVHQFESQLQNQLPAGAKLVAFGESTMLVACTAVRL